MQDENKNRSYRRLLGYAARYKRRFFLGVFFSFMVSIFNGISLSSLKPIFDVISHGGEKPFQIHFDASEMKLLLNAGYGNRLMTLYSKSDVYKSDIKIIKDISGVPIKKDKSLGSSLREWFNVKKLELNEYLIQFKSIEVLIAVAISILPIYLLRLLSDLGTVYFISSTGLMAIRDIRRDLYSKLTILPVSLFVREKTGILMSRIINDVNIVSDGISVELRGSINNFFIIFTHVLLLAFISYKLLLITLVGVPLVLWPINYFAKRVKHATKGEQEHLASLNGHLQEVISGIRVIRAFGMEDYEAKKFSKINQSLYQDTFRYRINHTLGPAIVELTSAAIISGLVIYGGLKITSGEFSPGSFFLFLFTLMFLMSPIKQVASWVNIINRTRAAGSRIFSLMDRQPEAKEPENPILLPKLKNKIEFKKISFHYPESEAQVLKRINLTVPVGSTAALVGHSGAGKSTMVDLIPRFYDPTEGAILFDGIDIRDSSVHDLRSKIGVVTQEVFLFNGTIKENISYGRDDISNADILKAAKMAYADEFVKKLPKGYDTLVGERGMMLSGGQRQRISIARALLKNPEILILDEATSALDTRSERLVQKALETLMQNRTTFVIAHRLSTIYQADQILVLNKGKIVERGTHEELLKKNGHYKKLHSMQFQTDGK